MNRDELIHMARAAGAFPELSETPEKDVDFLRRFAALVAAAEREACAKVCEAEAKRALWNWENDISGNKPFWNGAEQLTSGCADAIRARGQA